MTRALVLSVSAGIILGLSLVNLSVALAQNNNGECGSGLCGTPNQSGGGGGGGGGGSVLIANTNTGDTFQFADDGDGDGIEDEFDVCPFTADDQSDNDGDQVGNACDSCPNTVNADQRNTDGDAFGDACDDDIDEDGVLNVNDNCDLVPNPDQGDIDGDLLGDNCDDDIDGDGFPNATDACPREVGQTQSATCFLDGDGDGTDEAIDNCPGVVNVNQSDIDLDGIGDDCDVDIDDDGVFNFLDNCPLDANADQIDRDNDGYGDLGQAGNLCDPDGVAFEGLTFTSAPDIFAQTVVDEATGQAYLQVFLNRLGIETSIVAIIEGSDGSVTINGARATVIADDSLANIFAVNRAFPIENSTNRDQSVSITVQAALTQDDPDGLGDRDMSTTFNATIPAGSGDSGGGCNTTGDASGVFASLLMAWIFVRGRRKLI